MNKQLKEKAIEILSRETVKGEKMLEQFVWINTTEPKFSIGTPVAFSDIRRVRIRRSIYRDGQMQQEWHPARNCIGRIVEVTAQPSAHTFSYAVDYEVDLEEGDINGQKVTLHTAYLMEYEIRAASEYVVNKWSEI